MSVRFRSTGIRMAGRLALVGICFALSPAMATVDEIADSCNQCHGPNGVSTESDVPTIAGMSAFVIEDYLLTYQDEARPCHETEYRSGDTDRPPTTMCAIADELTDEEITAIAGHFAEQTFEPADQEFDPALAETGAGIHRRDCEKCHTDNAGNPEDDAGIMAGQWMPYLERVFKDYSSGERPFIEDKMEDKFMALSAQEKEALIHFYGSLQ